MYVLHCVGKLQEKKGVECVVDYLRRRYDSDQGQKYAFAKHTKSDIYTTDIDDLVKRLPKPSLVKQLIFFPAK